MIRKTFTFRWWQIAIYELALFSLGAGAAGYWPNVFQPLAHWFLLAFVVFAPLVIYFYLAQIRDPDASNSSHDRGASGHTPPHDV